MIKINKQFTVTGLALPYTYHFGSTSTNVSFSNQTGSSSSSSLTTDIIYPDEVALGLATITLTVTDKNGCNTQTTVTVENPCENLTFTNTDVSGYNYSATASSPGCDKIKFTYEYDRGVFELENQTDTAYGSLAKFKPVQGRVLPSSSVVSVTAENCYGCRLTSLSSMAILQPRIIGPNSRYISCADDAGLYGAYFTITQAPDSTPINWDTLDIGFGGSNLWDVTTITTEVVNGETRGLIHLAQSRVPTPETTYFRIYAEDVYGVNASWEGILQVDACSQVGVIPTASLIIPKAVNVESTAVSGDNIEIDVTNSVASLITPDWNTAQVLASPAYSSPSIAFRTTPDARQVIDYEYAGTSDLFAWTVDDINGNTLPPSTVSISVLPAPPVANTDNVAMVVGETEIFNVLANDTSSAGINPASLRIVTQSTSGGTANANSDGTITFISDVTDTGGTLVQYKVNDIYNQESNTGSLIITRISAGNGSSTNLCAIASDTVSITPFDYLAGTRMVNTTGTWTNLGTASPSPTAPTSSADSIDFIQGTHAAGTHTYRYTVVSGSATDYQDVAITFITYSPPSNNDCASSTIISFGGRGTNANLSNQNLLATCPGFAAATLSSPSVPSSWGLYSYTSDVWYSFTAAPYYDTISMTNIDYPINVSISGIPYGTEEGIYAPAIAIYDGTCGALVDRSSNVSAVSSQNISGQVVMSGASSKTYYIRVSSITGYEGKYSVNISA